MGDDAGDAPDPTANLASRTSLQARSSLAMSAELAAAAAAEAAPPTVNPVGQVALPLRVPLDRESLCYGRMAYQEVGHKRSKPVRILGTASAVVGFLLSFKVLLSMGIAAIALVLVSPAVFDLRSKLAAGPIITGFIFPLTFTMSAVWSRRESARTHLANIRTSCFHIFWLQSEWFLWMAGHSSMADFEADQHVTQLDMCLKNILLNLTAYLKSGNRGRDNRAYTRLNAELRLLSHLIERGGQAWGKQLTNAVQISVVHNYTIKIHANINHLRGIKDTKTPWGLKVFGWIGIVLSPIVLAPDFAQISCPKGTVDAAEVCGYGGATTYISGLFYAFIVASLFTIVSDLEDPFDGFGYDDLDLRGAYADYRSLVDVEPRVPPEHDLHGHEHDAKEPLTDQSIN